MKTQEKEYLQDLMKIFKRYEPKGKKVTKEQLIQFYLDKTTKGDCFLLGHEEYTKKREHYTKLLEEIL